MCIIRIPRAKTLLKSKLGGFTLSENKVFYKAIVIKGMRGIGTRKVCYITGKESEMNLETLIYVWHLNGGQNGIVG